MAPNVKDEVTCLSADIRVPPINLTDPEMLLHFPELMNNFITITNTAEETSEELELLREENRPSPNQFEFGYKQLVVETGESFLSDPGEKSSPNSEPSEDIFDPEYVLEANTDWWQISPIGVDESEFGIVDVPHFGDDLSNSGLWEDVDTFVSVVDVSGSEVTEEEEEEEEYKPVYKLDTKVTTVWGLDIIWEEEEN